MTINTEYHSVLEFIKTDTGVFYGGKLHRSYDTVENSRELKNLKRALKQIEVIEAVLQNLSKTKVTGLANFLKNYLEKLNQFSHTIKLESSYIYEVNPYYSGIEDEVTRATLLLLIAKFSVMNIDDDLAEKIKDINMNQQPLVLIYELLQFFQAKRLDEVDDLVIKLLLEVFTLTPLRNELKFIIDLGITSFSFNELIWVIDNMRITFNEKYTDGDINPLTYEELALEFEQFRETIFIIQNQKIIGLNLSEDFGDYIPESINLLTKLRFLNIDSNNVPKEIAHFHTIRHLSINMSELDFFPQQLTQLFKLRYLHIYGNFMRELPDIPKTFPKLRDLKLRLINLKRTPDWLYDFARKPRIKKYLYSHMTDLKFYEFYSRNKYDYKHVSKEDAVILRLLNIVFGDLNYIEDENYDVIEYHGFLSSNGREYATDENGNIRYLKLGMPHEGSSHKSDFVTYFPEEITKLRHLEALQVFVGESFFEDDGMLFYRPDDNHKIPEKLKNLTSLRIFFTNARLYSKNIKKFLDSLEKFEYLSS